MEPILFYGVPHGCSFGSIVALEWLGRPFRLCRIDMLDEAVGDVYRRAYALKQTPALVTEGGAVLGESLAILHHVAARGVDKGLGFAQGAPEFDALNQALSFLHTTLHSAFAPGWTAFKLAEDAPERGVLRDLARRQAASAYAHLETGLQGRDWLVGQNRTVADAYLVGVARWGEDLQLFDLAREYPRLHGYLQKLEADPAVAFAHAIEDEGDARSSGGFLGHVPLEALVTRLAA